MNKLFTSTALAVTCTQPFTAVANDKMEEMIITSSRIEMPLRQVATSVSVITSQDIKNLGMNRLADVLTTQPSIGISTNGGPGSTTALRIRGEENLRTLVLIDGMDISDTSGTQVGPRIENLLSAGIHRVEILRGPQGLMYGADAGGVINITSYAPEQGFGGDVSAEGGRYGSRQFAANVGGKNDTGDFSLSVSDFETDGYNARSTDTVLADKDGYENTTLHARGGWNVTDTLRLQLTVRDVDADNDYDTCFNANFEQVNMCSNTFEQTGIRGAIDYQDGRLSHSLAASRTETDREFYTEGTFTFGGYGELEKYEYLGSFKATESTRLVYGVDLKRESIDSSGTTVDRDQTGLYAEYQGEFAEQLYLTAGVRYDDNDDFGDFTSYRLSAAYLIETGAGTVKLKSSYGTGFRPPSPFEISYNTQPRPWLPEQPVFEALQEEKSEGLDIGVEYFANSGLYLEAVLFDQRVDNQINYDFTTDSYAQAGGEQKSRGVELIAEAPLADSWNLDANYTYNDTEGEGGASRIRRPEHLLNVGVQYLHASGRFSARLYARGSYEAVDIDGSKLDDYEVINLNASFKVTESLELNGRIENLLDEDYQEVPTYNTSGAAGYVGLRYSF